MTAETDNNQATLDPSSDGDGVLDTPDDVQGDLSNHGLVTKAQRPTRRNVKSASSFGVDDRELEEDQSTTQEKLFPDVDQDQQTLTGESAASICNFGADE